MDDKLQECIDQNDANLVKLAQEARKEQNIELEIQLLRTLVDTRYIIQRLQED